MTKNYRSNMIIQIDTREQCNSHIERYFIEHNQPFIRSKMYVGDYQRIDDGRFVIDKKYGLSEVYGNIVNDHERFRNECIKARDAGIKIVFLVEEKNINSLSDVAAWKNPRIKKYETLKKAKENGQGNIDLPSKPPMSSEKLMKCMITMNEKYGINWLFCKKENTAQIIIDLLSAE